MSPHCRTVRAGTASDRSAAKHDTGKRDQEESEGHQADEQDIAAARRVAPAFISNSHLGYVVIDTRQASAELRDLTIDILSLEKIAESDGRELYRPRGTEIPAPLQ